MCRLYIFILAGGEAVDLCDGHTRDTSAIFDIQWLLRTAAGPSLALATAAGNLEVVSLNQDKHLQLVTEHSCFDDAMASSVAVDRSDGEVPNQLGASSSKGELAILKVGNSKQKLGNQNAYRRPCFC